jgi:hypothetical protein
MLKGDKVNITKNECPSASKLIKHAKTNYEENHLKILCYLLILVTLFSCEDDSKSNSVTPTFKKELAGRQFYDLRWVHQSY